MCYYLGYDVKKMKHIRIREQQIEYGKKVSLRALHSGFEFDHLEIIRADKNGEVESVSAHWEFIPYWIKNSQELIDSRKKGIHTLNATAEKLLNSKVYKEATLKRRCILPVSWYFEWQHVTFEGEKKVTKIPYCIAPTDEEYFLLAGIWQPWTDQQTGETVDTFAIVTSHANGTMAKIHNNKKRMPLMLSESLANDWLTTEMDEKRIEEISQYSIPETNLKSWTLHKDFRANDNPTEPEVYTNLPAHFS